MKLVHEWDVDGVAPKEVLGGKGHGLAQMVEMGIPVPPGLTVPIDVMLKYSSVDGSKLPFKILDDTADAVMESIDRISNGLLERPMLVSVRSGAPMSMPGMMDTVLNVGLTPDSIEYWRETLGRDVAKDCFEKFIEQFHELWFGESDDPTSKKLQECLEQVPEFDTFKGQIKACLKLVWDSWDSPRAVAYREEHGISHDVGTACNVQAMVFGNLNPDSGTGVVFSRNPTTGEKGLFGEFLQTAQGEEVVAGTATPVPVADMGWLTDALAGAHSDLVKIVSKLEHVMLDMQDIEFTVEDGNLWILQTRSGKRTAKAAFRIACDLVDEGWLERSEAVKRIQSSQLSKAMVAEIKGDAEPNGVGLGASPGVAIGKIAYTAGEAKKAKGPSILLRKHTSPDDFSGMQASVGVLTAKGGMTSHAAVVARSMNLPCVVGCPDLKYDDGVWYLKGEKLARGQTVSVDGTSGKVYVGEVEVTEGGLDENVRRILKWAFSNRPYLWRMTGDETWKDYVDLPLEDSTVLWVDTTGLESITSIGGSKFEAAAKLVQLIAQKGRDVVFDLTCREERWTEPSSALYQLTGASLVEAVSTKLEAKRTILEGMSPTPGLYAVGGGVSWAKSVTVVDTIGDMAKASGLVQLSPDLEISQKLTPDQVKKLAEMFLNEDATVIVRPATPGVAFDA